MSMVSCLLQDEAQAGLAVARVLLHEADLGARAVNEDRRHILAVGACQTRHTVSPAAPSASAAHKPSASSPRYLLHAVQQNNDAKC